MKKTILHLVSSTTALAAMFAASAEPDIPGGWSPKFYDGLEAVGSVEVVPGGFKGKEASVRLKWESGAMKFGVAKAVTTELTGFVDWTVSAWVKSEGDYGYAGAAMEFFDGDGRSLGVVGPSDPMVSYVWRKMEWAFSAPKAAKKYSVHLLSLNKEPVQFAKMTVASRQGVDKGDIPFEVKALPAEWNKDWNGGDVRMLNFSDAPIPVLFYLKGRIKELNSPRLEVDIPECLEIREACCPANFEKLIPATTVVETDGARMVRHSFGKAGFYKWIDPGRYMVDACVAVKLVVAPKPGRDADGKSFTIRYRTVDGEKRGEEKSMEMAFRRLPCNLRVSKGFYVFSWNNGDRYFLDDGVASAAARAYEAAGLRSFRLGNAFGTRCHDRQAELAALYGKRPVKYVFSGRFGDLWRPGWCGLTSELSKKLGVRKAVSSDPTYAGYCRGVMCPEFFTTNPAFHEHLRGFIRNALETSGVKDGDWVTFDMEPWHSSTWCHCDECHKAFAAFAGLDHVPDAKEIAENFADKWALFRCCHNEKSVEIVSCFIREYNPTLKCVDYDYIMPYGDEAGMMAKRRACGKDTLENEKWLDGHLCSYYHAIDKAAFLAMRNDVRHLKKFYIPMAALGGYGSYLRPGEVLNPRQIRQFALAAFVHGCPGYAFYSGVCYDGEVLLKMMEAQDDVARYEDLPWGKVEGKGEPKCASANFTYASTVRQQGGSPSSATEVFALFNYEADETVRVSLAGMEYEVEPFGVKFVEVKDVK